MTYLEMESIISTVSSRILGHRYRNSLSTLHTVTQLISSTKVVYLLQQQIIHWIFTASAYKGTSYICPCCTKFSWSWVPSLGLQLPLRH